MAKMHLLRTHGVQDRFLSASGRGLPAADILPLMVEMYEFIRDFQGEVPGASPKDCGNYLDMNLGMARYLAGKYLEVLYHVDRFPESRLVYPE